MNKKIIKHTRIYFTKKHMTDTDIRIKEYKGCEGLKGDFITILYVCVCF